MEETKRNENVKLYGIILDNCNLKHPGGKLPESPWFTKTIKNEKVASVLLQLLFDTKRRSKRLAEKVTSIIITERNEIENTQLRRASLLQENIDIRLCLNKTKQMPDLNTEIYLKVLKAQGKSGPVSLSIWIGDEIRNLEYGDELFSEIGIKSNANIKAYREGEFLGETDLFFGSLLEDTHYLKVAEGNEFQSKFVREYPSYGFELEVKLKLSKKDREEILMQHLIESEEQLNEKQETEDFIEDMMKAIGVKISEDGEFRSLYKSEVKTDKSRDRCCNCVFL